MLLPCELLEASRKSHPTASRWVALCPKHKSDKVAPRFTWPLDPDVAFGEHDFRNWVKRCVRSRGLPVRIHWRARDGMLLAHGTIWDDGEQTDYDDEDLPTIAEAILPAQGELYIGHEHEETTALERAIVLALEQPDTVKNALCAIGDFLKTLSTPDELAQKRMAEYAADVAAARAAMAVENKIEEIMRRAGYDVDDEGDVTYPQQTSLALDEQQADEPDLDDQDLDDQDLDDLDDQDLDQLDDQDLDDDEDAAEYGTLHLFEREEPEPVEVDEHQHQYVGASDG